MPSDVSDGVVLPEESPPPGSDRGERRARRNGGGFENASSLSPSSRLPPLTAKATRTVSAPSSVRRSAARRAYRCAGSVRSSACSVRKNTTSCLYAAETDGRLGPDWASGPTGPGPAETSASWRNTHRSTSTFFVSFVSPSASDSRKISSTMRRDGGSGAACAASLRHGRNASARDAHSSVSRLNCGDQTHPMFDRRSGRRARGVRGQSREALAVTKRARLGRSREKKRALGFSRFFVERNALSRSFWLFGVFGERVSERHRLALDAGTHPSVLPVLPGRGGRWLTRHARLQHHRRALHEPLRANLRRAVAHGARSVRVYLLLAIRSKNSRETTWAR